MPSLTTEMITTQGALDALENAWDALLERCAARTPFLTFDWMATWWRAYGEGRELRVLTAREDGELLGIAPLYADNSRCEFGPRLRQLRLLGDEEVGADFTDWIVAPGREEDVGAVFADALAKHDGWRCLRLRSLTDNAACVSAMTGGSVVGGVHHCLCEAYRCPVLALPNTVEAFLDQPDQTYKLSARRRLRKLSNRPGFACELALPPERIDEGLSTLFALHGERWRSVGGQSIFDGDKLCRFYREVSTRMARKGRLELSLLSLEGEPLAAVYGFTLGEDYYCLQTACGKAGFELKAGNALMYARITSLIGKVRTFNFLRGDEPYKYQWGATDRLTHHYCAWRGLSGAILALLLPVTRRTARRIKRLVNRDRHGPTRHLPREAATATDGSRRP